MPFRPEVNQQLVIDNTSYLIAEHPAAPRIPYGQEGRQGIVYALVLPPAPGQPGVGSAIRTAALKVFKPHFRVPGLAGLAAQLAPYADMPGLQVCRRTVLVPQRHGDLLALYPDLTYAMLMPWIEGPTWMEVVLERQALINQQSLTLARALADTLSRLEQRGLAHGDLSAPNVMLPALAASAAGNRPSPVELVDVEQMYAAGLAAPSVQVSSSAGYAHRTAAQGVWGTEADRFAGAVLLAEMLGWCDARVRAVAGQESYFTREETQAQASTERYQMLVGALQERWGKEAGSLFARAWSSETLRDCPTFGEWLVALPRPAAPNVPPPSGGEEGYISAQLMQARRYRREGDLSAALTLYRRILAQLPPGSPLLAEVQPLIAELESTAGVTQPISGRPRPSPPRPAVPPAAESGHDRTMLISQREAAPPAIPPAQPPDVPGAVPPGPSVPRWLFPVIGAVILVAVIGVIIAVVAVGLYRQATTTAQTQATSTAGAVATVNAAASAAAQEDGTAAAIAAASSHAEASATAVAGATATALAQQEATAQADATAKVLAEENARATAEAAAIAAAGARTLTAVAEAEATVVSLTATASVPSPTPMPPTATATGTATATATDTPTPSATATETPPAATPTPGASPTPSGGVASLRGKLAFSLPQGTSYKVYVVEVGPKPPGSLFASIGNARQPALSHDGKWLLVNGTGGGVESIARLTSDGNQIQPVTCPDTTGAAGRPVWSPDDTRLAFDGLETDPGSPTVYIQRVDEMDCNLADNKFQIAGGPVVDANGLYPLWGPDNRIYFRSCATWQPGGASECGIWSAQPDGGDVRRLADNPNYLPTDVGRQQMLFMSVQEGNWDVYSVGLDGGQPRNLTNQPTTEVWGTLSPDGRMIAYLSNQGGGWAIWLANANGSDARSWLSISPDWGEVDPNRIAQERMSWSK